MNDITSQTFLTYMENFTCPKDDRPAIQKLLELIEHHRKSVICLLKNNHMSSAILLSGAIFELCAKVIFMKKSQNNYNKYTASCLLDELRLRIQAVINKDNKNAWDECINSFDKFGIFIIENDKSHIDIMKKLKNNYNVKNINELLKCYKKVRIQRSIDMFAKKIWVENDANQELQEKNGQVFYSIYNGLKHGNPFTIARCEMDESYADDFVLFPCYVALKTLILKYYDTDHFCPV